MAYGHMASAACKSLIALWIRIRTSFVCASFRWLHTSSIACLKSSLPPCLAVLHLLVLSSVQNAENPALVDKVYHRIDSCLKFKGGQGGAACPLQWWCSGARLELVVLFWDATLDMNFWRICWHTWLVAYYGVVIVLDQLFVKMNLNTITPKFPWSNYVFNTNTSKCNEGFTTVIVT